MNEEEAQKVLDELQNVRPEVLNDEAKRLFEAIMKIADERDLYKKIIKEMANMLEKDHEWFYSEFDDYTAEDFIEYFEKKVGE